MQALIKKKKKKLEQLLSKKPKTRYYQGERGIYYIMIKDLVFQENVTDQLVNVPNSTTSVDMKQKGMDLKGEMYNYLLVINKRLLGLNWGLLHCWWILYQLSYQECSQPIEHYLAASQVVLLVQFRRHKRHRFDPWVREDPLEMATHSSILAWKISRTEEPCGLQSIQSQRVAYDSSNLAQQSTTQSIEQIAN